jgi:pilus assembly protein CpaD
MHRKSYGAKAVGLVSLAAICIGLSGCLAEKSMWSENDTIKRNSVALHHITHDVAFAGGTTGLTDAQAAELDRFLARSLAGYGDTFSIDAGTDDTASSRREALVSYLRARGLVVSLQPAAFGGALAPDTVRLILNRYVVTPPPCPDWRQPSNPDFNNQPSGNLGCATETNLGLMVANPGDLVNGKTLGPSDAENAAKAVENYRAGKVKEPKSESTAGSSGGSGGSSGGGQ